MRLAWLITCKDFRHFRSRFFLWYGVLLAKTLLGLWLAWGPLSGPEPLGPLRPLALALVGIDAALAYLITALLVQDDPPRGGQPFWRTRPISGWGVLGAKGASLAILLVMPPLVAALPLWLVAGGRAGDLGAATLLQVFLQLVIIAPAAAMAALTPNLVAFLVGTLFVYVALPVTAGVVTGLLTPGARAAPHLPIAILAVFAAMAAYAASRYVTRRPLLTGAAGALAGVFILFILTQISALRPASASVEKASFRPRATTALQLTFESLRTSVRRSGLRSSNDLWSQVRVTGIPAGLGVRLVAEEQQLSWPDGAEVWRASSWSAMAEEHEARVIRIALGLTAPPDDGRAGPFTLGIPAGPTILSRLQAQPADYSLRAHLALLRPDISLALPLDSTNWVAAKGRGLRLLEVSTSRDGQQGVAALASEFVVRSRTFWGDAALRRPEEGATRAVLYDRTRDRLISLAWRDRGMLIIAGMQFRTSLLQGGNAAEVRAKDGGFNLAWINWEPVNTVRRHLAIEDARPVLPP